jgi:hypothetical protein
MTLVAVQRALREGGFFSASRPMPDLLAGLDLVALATVADVAPLTGLNRAFVAKGLALMRARGRPGLRILSDITGLAGPPTPYHLGFLIGPRINAGGRIGDGALGARLLSLTDPLEARRIAEELDRLNRERQELERATLEEADAQALAGLAMDSSAVIVTAGDSWHPGIAGLVASRLKEKFRRPAFAIAFDANGVGTGSGRSIPGVDLGRVVRAAAEAGILVKGGGHAMAAGVTLRKERLAEFRAAPIASCLPGRVWLGFRPESVQFEPGPINSFAATISQVRLFNTHPTGKALKVDRLKALMGDGGIQECGYAQNCVQACPKQVPLTKAISDVGRDVGDLGLGNLALQRGRHERMPVLRRAGSRAGCGTSAGRSGPPGSAESDRTREPSTSASAWTEGSPRTRPRRRPRGSW